MTEQGGRTIRIGGAAAGFGDGAWAAPVLVRSGALDYVMFDFLSEYYMPMAGRARRADPEAGFVQDFPDGVFAAILPDLMERQLRLVTNAGGVNPLGCAEALQAVAHRLGLRPRIAIVHGDDLLDRADALVAAGRIAAAPPGGHTGINAYVGAFPIARALALGADIVVTGRVVDSALALGPLIHEFGWAPQDYDRLAAGSLIGHLLECGAQASGGLFTDWREIGDYAEIGYPIAACTPDGAAIITKPEGTGGLVSVGTVAEQLLYEIGDPRAYRLPDVTADFSAVRLEPAGPDRVRVTGARGTPPGPDLKAIATWDDGWMGSYGFVMRGPEAAAKARVIAASVLKRAGAMLRARNMAPFRRNRVDIIGQEESYGAQARPGAAGAREILCRVALEHEDPRAIGLLMREQGTAAVSMAPGIAGSLLFSPPGPIGRSEAFFLPASEVPVTVTLDGASETMLRAAAPPAIDPGPAPAPPLPPGAPDETVPLSRLAWVRSGDKGDTCNVGVVARRPEYLPWLAAALTEQAIARHYAHMFTSPDHRVVRHYLPGIAALNLLLEGALDGGCTVSLHFDPFGKGAAQEILDFPVPVPAALA